MTTNGHNHEGRPDGAELAPDVLDALQVLRSYLAVQEDPNSGASWRTC